MNAGEGETFDEWDKVVRFLYWGWGGGRGKTFIKSGVGGGGGFGLYSLNWKWAFYHSRVHSSRDLVLIAPPYILWLGLSSL